METNISPSRNVVEIIARAAGWGMVVFLLSIAAQWIIYERVLDDLGGMRLISPLIAATVTALLSFRLQMITSERAKATVRALQAIADLNHHIRNALQVIEYETYATAEPNRHIREAAQRIEQTLHDVLPGVSRDEFRRDRGDVLRNRGS